MYLVEQLVVEGNKLVYRNLFITDVLTDDEKQAFSPDRRAQVNPSYDTSAVELDENNFVALFRLTELENGTDVRCE